MSRILITSALPYINGIKHLGTLAGSMLPADVYARFQRARGRETLYICATEAGKRWFYRRLGVAHAPIAGRERSPPR